MEKLTKNLLSILIIGLIFNSAPKTHAKDTNGSLSLNDQTIQQKASNDGTVSNTKAEQTLPDLFAPEYQQGLSKEQKNDDHQLNEKTQMVFAKNLKTNDQSIKANQELSSKIFAKKAISSTSDAKESSTTRRRGGGLWIGVSAVTLVAIGLGIFLGTKLQKQYFAIGSGKHE